ncbi:hypothetical protein FQR65_LT00612 [Abscondita terminalis]|nr:hypothetical protein FQR65_LT00612 [Abscondita terminalis]
MVPIKKFCALCLFIVGVCGNTNFTVHDAMTNTSRFKEMERITQPIEETRITQQVVASSGNSSFAEQRSGNSSSGSFKPSPQVETYYEYNRVPVVPALPEPKYALDFNINDKLPHVENRPWMDKPTVIKIPSRLPSWNNKISFPTTQSSYLPLDNQPYQYVVEGNFQEATTSRNQYPYPAATGQNDVNSKNQFSYTAPEANYETTTRTSNYDNQPNYPRFGSMPGYETTTTHPNYNSFTSYTKFGVTPSGNSGPGISNKYGDPFVHKGGYYGNPSGMEVSSPGEHPYIHKTHYGHSSAMIPYEPPMQSPWKKVIKFLSAVIPIGILLSALTPTIINVAPMNTSQVRGRAVDSESSTKRLVYSLNHINKLNEAGCEERVMCELLLGVETSKNSKKYAEELIDAFKKQDNPEELDELKAVFDAVQKGNCNSLNCTSIEEEAEVEENEESSTETS